MPTTPQDVALSWTNVTAGSVFHYGFAEQAFEHSPVAMAVTAVRDGRYLCVNAAACCLLGRSNEELLRLRFSDITHPDDPTAADYGEHARRAVARGEVTFEKRYVRPDGKVVWASLFVTPIRNEDGLIVAFFCQMLDITSAKEREAELAQRADDLAVLGEIRSAIAEDRLVLYAQPIVELARNTIVQHELLIRLRKQNGEVLSPVDFLPVAERFECIKEIDQWVTRRAILIAASGSPVEVNLSAESMGDSELLGTIHRELSRSGADPQKIVFEITETAIIADMCRGQAFAAAIRQLGCGFALDDFGTGYGTFTYIKHLPIDFLKIDAEFVRELTRNDKDERLVKTIVAIAREFEMQTTAEGIEDATTLSRLRDLGVDRGQGFFLGRPRELFGGVPAPMRKTGASLRLSLAAAAQPHTAESCPKGTGATPLG